ncbi:MAG: hypothetical protein NUV69_00605 [Candidatus Curtissbacteria bacterium]|nr:hypothetical protein [Candidatus Curtissbacteria bacterium]
MSAYGTKLAEGFSSKVMQFVYDRDLLGEVTNRNYEGEINGIGSKLNILDFGKLSEKTYADAALTADSLTENNGQLIIDTYKSFYWKEKTLAKWLSYIKNPHPYIVEQVGNERSLNMDNFVFDLYGDVGGGNWVGTDETTGTVTVDVTTGQVTGDGTTFTSAMVGRPFKADGHTSWYRVKTFNSTTDIIIEDDLDDVTSVYTGGAIAATATYTIQATTVLTITAANILNKVATLAQRLNLAEKDGYSAVPDTDRFLIAPPEFFTILTQGTGVVLHVDEAYQDLVKKGFMGTLQGFKLFMSNRLNGDNTAGYYLLAGHQNWMTFAEKVLDARMEEDLIGDFGTAYKDLFVYGAKVKDINRHQAALGFWKF